MKLTKEQFVDRVINEAKNIGLDVNQAKADKLYEYKEMLVEWNEKMNLTAITDDEEIICKHIVDSLEACKYISQNQRVVDVGTGAGLPGVIISIYFDGDIEMVLMDALDKRINFLNAVIDKLKLKNTTALHARAEELSRDMDYREKFDVVISRAVAALNILIELTTALVKRQGKCIYMKADKTDEEMLMAQRAIKELDLSLNQIHKYQLNINNEILNRTLVIFNKENTTSDKYPRMFAKIKKQPL